MGLQKAHNVAGSRGAGAIATAHYTARRRPVRALKYGLKGRLQSSVGSVLYYRTVQGTSQLGHGSAWGVLYGWMVPRASPPLHRRG